LNENAGKGGGLDRLGSVTLASFSRPEPAGLDCSSFFMQSIAPGLNVKAGRGARLGFRDILRECMGLEGSSMSGVGSNGVCNDVGIETEAISGNDDLTALLL